MVYRAAIIGCHGVGKTTLAKTLKKRGHIVFDEAPLNKFMGKNAFLAEINILLDNIKINNEIGNSVDESISDRFAFLDVIIYSETFLRLGWITDAQLKTIYNVVNNTKHKWFFPKKLICMRDSIDIIKKNIINRNRNEKYKEFDEEYLKTTFNMFNQFYDGTLDFRYLSEELKQKVHVVPKLFVKCGEEVECTPLNK